MRAYERPTAFTWVRYPDPVSHECWVCYFSSSSLQGFSLGSSGSSSPHNLEAVVEESHFMDMQQPHSVVFLLDPTFDH